MPDLRSRIEPCVRINACQVVFEINIALTDFKPKRVSRGSSLYLIE